MIDRPEMQPKASGRRHMQQRHQPKYGPYEYPTTLDGLRAASSSRVLRWHGAAGVDDWSVTDWSNAAAGEMGEVCNAVKKLRRIEGKLPNHATDPDRRLVTKEAAIAHIAEEMADTIIYLDLLAKKLNIDLTKAIAKKFNQTSEEYGFPERLIQ